jgi:uncharacterized protein DUF6909
VTVARLVLASPSEEAAGRLSDEVELYQRTYNALLRSSGETQLRVLESSHQAMGSSLHPLANSDEPDLGAFIYFVARLYFDAHGPEGRAERRRLEQECGVSHLPSSTALRVPAQTVPLAALRPERLDPPLGDVDADRLAASEAVVVNIDYPLGVAAYNILRKVAVDSSGLRGVFVLGKAATLNADVGDVMISSVVHDEHSRSTYWLDNAFGVDDLAPDPQVRHRPRQPARSEREKHLPCRTAPISTSITGRPSRSWRWRRGRTATRCTRSPTPTAIPSARRSTSRSCRWTSGSSTTPPTRPTRRPGRSARAACRTTGWTRHTRRRWRSCGACCGWEGALE